MEIALITNDLFQDLGECHFGLFIGYKQHLIDIVLINEGCLHIVHIVNKLTLIATCYIDRLKPEH